MINISIEISAPQRGSDPVLEVAAWIATAMTEEPIDGMVIHGINVEVMDA